MEILRLKKFLPLCFLVLVLMSRFQGVQSETARTVSLNAGFTTIQEAINNANPGDTILVPAGIYYEHVVVNKTVSLIGEERGTTVIDGSNSGTVVQVTADGVNVSSLTVQNSGWGWTNNGIYVYQANNCEIKNNYMLNNCHNIRLNCSRDSRVLENRIDGNGYGIRLISSVNCTAINNNVSNCIGGVHLENATDCVVKWNYFAENNQGIRMYSPCSYNMIFENTVRNNVYDGMIDAMPGNATFFDNRIFHNNFINSTYPFIYTVLGNIWDDGYPSGGNYWSQYNGTDTHSGPYQNETGSDGIGDTPYAVNRFESDGYPLMHPYGSVRNLNTGLSYFTIQSSIDASETLNGHTLQVGSGTYREHVIVHKSLNLVGENRTTTIIDGANVGTVVFVTANNTGVSGFTVRNSGLNYPPYGNDCGVFLDHVSGTNIGDSLVTNNRIGIYLSFSQSGFLGHNIVSSNFEDGITLWYSGNNTLSQNEISNNTYNFGVFGGAFSDYNNSIDATNTVDGKAIQYVTNVKDKVFDDQLDIGVLYLVNCFNVTVRNLNLTKNGHGVFCYNVTGSEIENVTALRDNYGICLQDSADNRIDRSLCLNNWVGINLQGSDHNTVEDSMTASCEKGISLYGASYNNLIGNTISSNLYGIRFFSSHTNKIFHNNLIENTGQVDLINSYQNAWDNDFEGNFWSNYVGSDISRDGLGDTPQIINDDNRDRYPLFGNFSNLTTPVDGLSYFLATISNSTILNVDFQPLNSTLRLRIDGADETDGFCRIRVPHALIEPEISVIIDDGSTEVLYPNYNLYDDGAFRWIYFAYHHSNHEIFVIPESSLLSVLLSISVVTICSLALIRGKARRK